MATINREIDIDCSLDRAWTDLRNFGSAARLFAGVLVDCKEADGVRTVTFANGLIVQEQLVTRDDRNHRIAYTVVDGPFSQHSASMQLFASGDGVRFVWISDFLPDAAASGVEPLVEAGCEAIKLNLEAL